MNHACTYFDSGFLIQGLALWRSLARHDPDAALWVLALDETVTEALNRLGDPNLRVVKLGDLENGYAELAKAKADRSRTEYMFTLSPCWPLWLLEHHPEIGRITYLDADLFFFSSPASIFQAMDEAGASVLITPHRFSAWQRHYEKHGRYNVGVLSFRNDEAGLTCLRGWRAQCIAWCFDRIEEGRYADQKYLDAWPGRLGGALLVLEHPGVNLAPWNWSQCALEPGEPPRVDGKPVVVFHFARFRPTGEGRWWQSGQLDYGVMPQAWRDALYTPYWRALQSARAELRRIAPEVDFPRRAARLGRTFWRALPLRALFGGTWLRLGDRFFNLRCGLGRYSGRVLSALRRLAG